MSKYRPVLRVPKPPKSNNIDAVLKFIQEQKEKPSEAAAQAKKLTKISNDVKNREKKATQVKAFMTEFRKVMKGAEQGKQICTSSMIDLSGFLPELPELLKFDASLQNKTNEDVVACVSFLDQLQSILVRKTESKSDERTYKDIHLKFEQVLDLLALPEEYDNIVELVEKTKIKAEKQEKYDLAGLNDDWKQQANEQIEAFNKIEDELKKKNRDWLVENGFNPDEPYGGWDDLEHQRFILTNCAEVTVEFDRTQEEIIRHKKWYIRQQYLNRKIDALHQELKTRIAKMKYDAAEEERQLEEQRIKDLQAKQRQEALSEEKSILDERLKVEREEKRKRDQEKAEQEEQERKLREEEENRKKQQYLEEKSQLKQKVQAEKERRKEIEERIKRNREIEAQRQRELDKERMKEIKVVVSGRRQERENKIEQKKQENLARKEKEIEKQKRLEMLAQQVRDEFGLDDVVADPEKPTKIMEIRKNMEKEEKPMFNPTSFASSVIEADPRIRIENALREAGLMNSPYAQSVITQMSALRTAPGLESHIKF